jgi:uncharacterized membrane protein YkgB
MTESFVVLAPETILKQVAFFLPKITGSKSIQMKDIISLSLALVN